MNSCRKYGIALLAGAMLLAGWAGNALALTGACTTITNQATLSYSVGGVPQGILLSDGDNVTPGIQSTDFTVDTKVDLTVSTFNSPVTATGINQVLIFRITNTGNDTQRYQLQLYAGNGEDLGGGVVDNFDMANVRVVVDTSPDGSVSVNSDGTINLAADETAFAFPIATNGADLGLTPDVAGMVGASPNNVIEVYVISDVPAGRVTGDDAVYTLKARTYQTATNYAGPGATNPGEETTAISSNATCVGNETVLADGAASGGVGGSNDAANDGDYYATGVYSVSAPTISVTKTATPIYDPINLGDTPKAIPGAYIQYVITIENTGAASATLSTITDPLVASLAIDPNLMEWTGPATWAAENANGNGFKVVVSNSTRAQNGSSQYFTTTNSVDGVDMVGSTVTATFATLLPAEGSYTAGELKTNEKVTLTFNAIIQ